MKVGILGSGDVAKALGTGFLKHGHEVMLGTRTPSKLVDWAAQNAGGRVGGFTETAKFGEVVALAVKGTVASAVLRECGATDVTLSAWEWQWCAPSRSVTARK